MEDGLRILALSELIEVILIDRPFGSQPRPKHAQAERDEKPVPDRDDERTAPHRALIPGKIVAAAREISAFAQGVGRARIFEDGELLPEKHVDEKAGEQPDLNREQTKREHDREKIG